MNEEQVLTLAKDQVLQYLDNAQWMNAQTEFESALALFQTDQAKKLLEKAKKKMK